jgi:hypothetical protein
MKNTLKKIFLSSIILCSLCLQTSAKNTIIFFDSSKLSSLSKWDTLVNSVSAGALFATAFASYTWLYRNSKLNAFEQWLIDTSTVSKRYHCFSNWGKTTFNTASNLITQSAKVRKKLLSDLNNPNFTPFRDNDGNSLHYNDAEARNRFAFAEAIINEKKYLERELECLAHFTPLATLIYKNVQALITISLPYNKNVANLILIQCQEIIENNTRKLKSFENIVENSYSWLKKNSTLEGYLLSRAPLFSKQIIRTGEEIEKEVEENDIIIPRNFSYNPLQWKLVNSLKATRLFYQGLKRYIWLLTLEHIIVNTNI